MENSYLNEGKGRCRCGHTYADHLHLQVVEGQPEGIRQSGCNACGCTQYMPKLIRKKKWRPKRIR